MTTEFMDGLIGDWTFEGRGVPDDRPVRTETETVVRRGVWLVIESDDGARFQLAFDPKTNAVTGDFVNWEEPGLWTYRGAVEADGKLHLRSRGPSFDVEGEETDYDDVFEILSPDTRRLTGRLRRQDGEWRDFTVTNYRRKS